MTLIVGANNSGKSAFLEAAHHAAKALTYEQVSIAQPRRNMGSEHTSVTVEAERGQVLRVATINRGGSQMRAQWDEDQQPSPPVSIRDTPARRAFNPYFHLNQSDDPSWHLHAGELSRTETRDAFTGRLVALDADPERKRRFNELLAEVVGYELEWTIDQMSDSQTFVKMLGEGGWHTSEGLGEGLVSLLFIVDALYDSAPGSLVVIDEPELSLHPPLIRRLRRVFSRFAATRQILLATHSPQLIDWADIRNGAAIARVFKEPMSGASVVRQASRKTLTEIARLAADRNLYHPHTVGVQAAEAFFLEDGIIITEGQDDVVFAPRVLEDLGLPPSDRFFGWGAGGAHNIVKLVTLFAELGFTRIATLFDNDKLDEAEKVRERFPTVVVEVLPAPDIRFKDEQPAKPEVVGLLEPDKRTVRAELRSEAAEVFTRLLDAVTPHAHR